MTNAASLDVTDILILSVVAVATIGFLVWRSGSLKKAPATSTSGTKTTASSSGKIDFTAGSGGKQSFLDKLNAEENPHQLILFYGSQTGTAEDLANRLANEVQAKFGIGTLICDLEEYDMTELLQWPSREDQRAQGKTWLCGFFLATYGEGEPTDNAADFYEWLMDGRGKGDDEGVDEPDDNSEQQAAQMIDYIVFGLGNTTYEYYNATARRVDKKLQMWGAKRLGERGEGDDDNSLEDDFLKWKPAVLESIAALFNVTEGSSKQAREAPHVPLFNVSLLPVSQFDAAQLYLGEHSAATPRRWLAKSESTFAEVNPRKTFDMKHPYYSPLTVSKPLYSESSDTFSFAPTAQPPPTQDPNYRISSAGSGIQVSVDRQCYHLELDTTGSNVKYETGDHVGVLAENRDQDINELVQVLGLSGVNLRESVVKLDANLEHPSGKNAKRPFPLPATLYTVLKYYLDLKQPLKQHHFEILGKYAADEAERALLYQLVDDREFFLRTVDKGQKTLTDIIREFPSVAKIPLAVVLTEILPRIAIRYYSISSSSKQEPNKIGITAVVVRYALESPLAKNESKSAVYLKEGLATSWLERCHKKRLEVESAVVVDSDARNILPHLHLPMYIRTSTFKLPRNPSVPVIMVGPGTGLAPFRGFVHDRFFEARRGKAVGRTLLFYGCRSPDIDFLYRPEFEALQTELKSWSAEGYAGPEKPFDFELVTAFSRVPDQKKVYVQHRLAEYKAEIWEILEKKKGFLFICGDGKYMAKDVHKAVISVGVEIGGFDEERAHTWVKNLKAQGRYLEDVW
ncbi:uncharacterized protein BJ171DRAFT_445986 [Polychytrium aggregatum]|uniref:uncharacterized protein n=1 Tax=Polychytrium aggregatum TaxID=110093 RepID=UPI0022FE5184|nr:uncharacterized protein BJ171DRAFT_445986 [Polychytrium aggregatum]KAI9197406.1 hypothetical protein BJ171DRAFT_445986 [Polychytrium aggregatum]